MAAGHDPTSSKSSLGAFEADKNKILTALLDTSEQSCSIVAIIGPRGVGKTYLAKEVYTSAKIQKHFDVHIWLSAASEYFDKHKALNHMRKQLSIKEDTVTSSFLRGKRYCVVIDDLDCDNSSRGEAWSVILKELPENYNGSRVLVTSRPEYGFSETRPILMLYEVGPRGDKESINILLNMVFPLQNDPMRRYVADENELLRLLMKFVRICKGLPWPLRILGGLLSAEGPPFSYSWNKVLRSIQAIEGGMSFIQFAMRYRDLPSHEMRAAFLYFLTFPQNAQIHAKYLVNLWIEENITEHHNSGMHILEDLVRRSMIEVTKRCSNGSIKYCWLHDPLLHSLAIQEAKENRFVRVCGYYSNSIIFRDLFDARIKIPACQVKKDQNFNARKMDLATLADTSCIFHFGVKPHETALMSDRVLEVDDTKKKFEAVSAARRMGNLRYLVLGKFWLLAEILKIIGYEVLETLVVSDTTTDTLPSDIFLKMPSLKNLFLRNTKVRNIPIIPLSLRTLDVTGTPIGALQEFIWTDSLNLESLILRNTKVRDIAPYNFPNLMYLDVRNTFVSFLPGALWSTGKLRSVLASNTFQHLDGPPPTAALGQLETLETVHVPKSWEKKLPKFNNSNFKKLGLSYFQTAFTSYSDLNWDVITGLLSTLWGLSWLKIQGINVPATIIDVRTSPSYQQTLKSLWVGGSYSQFSLSGIKMPPQLTTLTLENLEFRDDPMPILEKLLHLKNLRLRWLLYNAQTEKMIFSIGEFPQLERLQLYHISGLEELSVQKGALPKITHVVIECCKALKNLSTPLVDRRTPLKELHLHAMPSGFTAKFSHLPFVKITEN